MKRLCKNCQYYAPDMDEQGFCHSARSYWSAPSDKGEVGEIGFCSDFFPPNPSCFECRWFKEGEVCYVAPKPREVALDALCAQFQPNGEGE